MWKRAARFLLVVGLVLASGGAGFFVYELYEYGSLPVRPATTAVPTRILVAFRGSHSKSALANEVLRWSRHRTHRDPFFAHLAATLWLAARWSEEDLTRFLILNAGFGGGTRGIDAAAQRDFGKSVRELRPAEIAWIAQSQEGPIFRRSRRDAVAHDRRDRILRAMRAAGALDESELDDALRAPLPGTTSGSEFPRRRPNASPQIRTRTAVAAVLPTI